MNMKIKTFEHDEVTYAVLKDGNPVYVDTDGKGARPPAIDQGDVIDLAGTWDRGIQDDGPHLAGEEAGLETHGLPRNEAVDFELFRRARRGQGRGRHDEQQHR